MNTCLSTIYLKLSQFDARYLRLATMTLALVLGGGYLLHLPIAGDVGG